MRDLDAILLHVFLAVATFMFGSVSESWVIIKDQAG